jgi:hypothetical protein
MDINQFSRRQLLEAGIGVAAARPLLSSAGASLQAPAAEKKMLGIQINAASFVDEGVEQVLDILQQKIHLNTLFLVGFTYGRGLAGRQFPGQPFPDHGKQEPDVNFHGGNYATVHPQYYKDTGIRPEITRAPDHGDLDIIATVLPAAKKRGMKTIVWAEDGWTRESAPGLDKLCKVDLHGRPGSRLCFNNPYHRNFLLGLVEDYARSYQVDGIMWGSEGQGALAEMLNLTYFGPQPYDPGAACCFCTYCERKARQQGRWDFARVKTGFLELEKHLLGMRAGRKPVDGQFVTLLRLLMRYPEMLGWEQFQHDSLRETYAALYQKIKSIRPELPVGWHIWHNNSFSPLYRAQQDLQELSKYSDFLKVVMYHNCGGERMAGYIDRAGANVFGELFPQESLEFDYRVMHYRERGYEQVAFTGLSADYVAAETKRAVDGAAGTKTRIYPGIDIDIPTELNHSRSTADGTKAAVLASLKAGAHGLLLSRKYSEMRLTNLRGAAEAFEELGLV